MVQACALSAGLSFTGASGQRIQPLQGWQPKILAGFTNHDCLKSKFAGDDQRSRTSCSASCSSDQIPGTSSTGLQSRAGENGDTDPEKTSLLKTACVAGLSAKLVSFEIARRSVLQAGAAVAAALAAGFLPALLPAIAFAREEGITGASRAAVSRTQQRHVIITGGNSGIGKAMAEALARNGMSIVLACRNRERGEAAAADIRSLTGNPSVSVMQCDLASLRSVRSFASAYLKTGLPLHVLVNNAGVMACPQSYTEDGLELQFGVNHEAHFVLTNLLLPCLAASGNARRRSRVVVVTSAAERLGSLDFEDLNFRGSRSYNRWSAYCQSKLANCLFTLHLAARCRAAGLPVTATCFHPGIVDTQLARYILPKALLEARKRTPEASNQFARFIGLRTPEEGAATGVYLALAPELEGMSGGYYEDLQLRNPSSQAQDVQLAARLWAASESLARLSLSSGYSTESFTSEPAFIGR